MSLMEKRIETVKVSNPFLISALIWMNEPYGKKDWDRRINSVALSIRAFGNEWALWKKGLRPWSRRQQDPGFPGMNEPYGKKDWDAENDPADRCSTDDWMNEPYGKKDWDSSSEMVVAPDFVITNEWALWKKGLRPGLYAGGFSFSISRMNEPYGKKDWD